MFERLDKNEQMFYNENERKTAMKKGIVTTIKVAKVTVIIVLILSAIALLGLVGGIETKDIPTEVFVKPLIMLLVSIGLCAFGWKLANAMLRWWQR